MSMYETAVRLVQAGLSILPIKTDGSKAPPIPWGALQNQPPDELTIRKWFLNNGHTYGTGIICGAVSGNLEVLDFDDSTIIQTFLSALQSVDSTLYGSLYMVNTPSDGLHIYYRCSIIEGNQKLAMSEDGRGVLIETRGEGGYVIAPGSPPRCHPSAKTYEVRQGDARRIPIIKVEERESLFRIARSFDQRVKQQREFTNIAVNSDFEADTQIEKILEPHEWTRVKTRGVQTFWRKPGAKDGHHATWNFEGSGRFHVFSTSAAPFDSDNSYSKFECYALLNHGGDHQTARETLRKSGYQSLGKTANSKSKTVNSRQNYSTDFSQWQESKPLQRDLEPPKPFPMFALGPLENAASKVRAIVQSPDAICGFSLLAAANLAVHAHGNIEIDGRVSPISMYLISIASSGERKSAADNEALKAHRSWQERKLDVYRLDALKYKTDLDVYDQARKRILGAHKKTDFCKRAEIRELDRPLEPLEPIILMEEPTYEGLAKVLANGFPSAGLFSSEGGRFLGGHAMNKDNSLKTATGLSSLYDRGEFDRVRASDGAGVSYGKRLGLHLMLQPGVSALLLSNQELIDQGLLSRCVVVQPESTSKVYCEVDLSSEPVMLDYWRKIDSILSMPLPLRVDSRNVLQPPSIRLSRKAKEQYVTFHNSIQRQLASCAPVSKIKGFASKAHDHAARLAATLALYQDIETREVSGELFEMSMMLVEHSMSELIRLVDTGHQDVGLTETQKLLEWLLKRKSNVVSLVEIYQDGPSFVRSASKARRMMEVLWGHGCARQSPIPIEYGGILRNESWEIRRP